MAGGAVIPLALFKPLMNINLMIKIVDLLADVPKEEAIKTIEGVKEILDAKPEDAEFIDEKK